MEDILFNQERETELYGERKFAEGEAVGDARGVLKSLSDLFKEGIISLSVAAKKAGMSEEAFQQAALQS